MHWYTEKLSHHSIYSFILYIPIPSKCLLISVGYVMKTGTSFRHVNSNHRTRIDRSYKHIKLLKCNFCCITLLQLLLDMLKKWVWKLYLGKLSVFVFVWYSLFGYGCFQCINNSLFEYCYFQCINNKLAQTLMMRR